MSNKTKKLLKIILPILIIVVGVVAAKQLMRMRTAPDKAEKPVLGTLVRTVEVTQSDVPIIISATGTAQSRRVVDITPQVSGKISWIAPSFIAGGFFREGDPLFSIEKDDYELDLEKAGAELAMAELELARVESQAAVARQDWHNLHPDTLPTPLVVYEPQAKSAQARVAAAKATIRRVRLDLKRTSFLAPFNCRVRSESVDIGQYIRSGSPVAQIAGTSSAEVIVHLSPDVLQWLNFPDTSKPDKGSAATVIFSGSENNKKWQGYIDRSLGEIDARSRMVGVVITVDDPYSLTKEDPFNLPLAEGLFVTVDIEGRPLKNAFQIPRSALRDGSTVWLVTEGDQLTIRPVTVSRKNQNSVLVREGLEDGARVITSGVNGAANGMQLRIISGEESQ
ncbi:MAG: efflux RND transporter periplasmic adaptor subunit [Desulfobulbaceae bacterium]|uniref:Efflux RND transporter periplasmic adaptor subunit n=1 Tax=Candidatus Desulfobia pelagia TaxID=2841692 RepID=A0A8J6TEU9_9BACT|nr:efflux RND transporter periplasmic adaptor subunit [Candidatus Desulfobia pelagia]